MKKLLIFFFLLVLSIPLIAQNVDPPTDWADAFANINVWLGSLAGVSALTVFLASAVNRLFSFSGFIKQLVAWVIAVIILFLGNLVNLGFMAELNWWHTLIYGLAAGFIANGLFDVEFMKTLLKVLKIEKSE